MYYNKEDQLREEMVPVDLVGSREREFIANPKNAIDIKLEMKQYFDCRRFVLETLTPREARMFAMYYGLYNGEFMTLAQIGNAYNITRSRVGQIIDKALRKLRHPSRISLMKYLTDEEVGYTGKGYLDFGDDIFEDEYGEDFLNSRLDVMADSNEESFSDKLARLIFEKKDKETKIKISTLTDEQKQSRIVLDILLTKSCDIYTRQMEENLCGKISGELFTPHSWESVLDMDIEKLKSKGYQRFIHKVHNSGLYFKSEFKYIEDWENAICASMIEKGLDNIMKAFAIPEIDNLKYVLRNTYLEELDLSVRAYNCLKRAGIDNLMDLVCRSEEELIKVRNFGRRSMDEVIAKVRSLGLDIRPEDTSEEMWIAHLSHMPITSEDAVNLIKDNKTVEDIQNNDEPKQSIKEERFDELLETRLEELDLSVHSYNCLMRAGIDNLEDLICRSEEELIKVRNLGRRSMEEAIAKAKSFGLDIRPEEVSEEEWIKQLKQKTIQDTPETIQESNEQPKVQPETKSISQQKILNSKNNENKKKLDVNKLPEDYRGVYAIGARVVADKEVKKDAFTRLISSAVNNISSTRFISRVKYENPVQVEENLTESVKQSNENDKSERLIAKMISSYYDKTQDKSDKKILDIIVGDISVIDSLEESFVIKHKDELMQIILKDRTLNSDKRLQLLNTVYNSGDSGWSL